MLSIVGQSRSSMPRRRARAPDLAVWIVTLKKTQTAAFCFLLPHRCPAIKYIEII
jgi:hypothetical protein